MTQYLPYSPLFPLLSLGRHEALSGRIIHLMKRLSFIITVMILLTSCMTNPDNGDFSFEDEMRISHLLRQSERNAVIESESIALRDLSGFPVNSTYAPYIQDLPQLHSGMEEYEKLVASILSEALEDVTDSLLSELEGYAVDDVLHHMEAGYSSITDELADLYHDDVYMLFLDCLLRHEAEIDESFSAIRREAEIWRKNQANLDLVRQGEEIAPLEEISMEEIASYAADSYFRTLSEREVIQRGRLLAEGGF